MDDDDPALGLKVKVLFLVTLVVLIVGSVSPAVVNKTEEVKPVSNISVGAKTSLIDKEVPKANIISGTFKPSIKSGYAYRWYKRSWINYCPGCHKYGTLRNNPKGVHEGELTCTRCDADFCGVTGTDKGYGRRWSLRRA